MQKYGLYIPPEVLDNRKLKAIEKNGLFDRDWNLQKLRRLMLLL